MERTQEHPWGRCAACGYSGSSNTGDHPYSEYDYLCGVCINAFNKEYPFVVEKKELTTGDVFSQYRHRTAELAGACLARLKSNPEANEDGRFSFVMYKEDSSLVF